MKEKDEIWYIGIFPDAAKYALVQAYAIIYAFCMFELPK